MCESEARFRLKCYMEESLSEEILKDLRLTVNWYGEEELDSFLDNFLLLISPWMGALPDLRIIFQPMEINRILSAAAVNKPSNIQYQREKRIIDFVTTFGHQVNPELDEDDKPLLLRTTPLHQAVRGDLLAGDKRLEAYTIMIIPKLFSRYRRFDVNYTDEYVLTHFHVACMVGCYKEAEQFLKFGQDPNGFEKGSIVDPPLIMALKQDHYELAQLLLTNGADPNVADAKGLRPLHIICQKKYDSYLVRWLVKLSHKKYLPLQVNALDSLGRTALQLAVANKFKKSTKWLLKYGADPTMATPDGSIPLHMACKKCADDRLATTLLLDCDDKYRLPQLRARDKSGYNSLHLALDRGRSSLVALLLKCGADPEVDIAYGLTPLWMIIEG